MGDDLALHDGRYVSFFFYKCTRRFGKICSRSPCAVISSHPPFFGFAFSLTMIGYTFGLWPGALLAIAASMTGAGVAFLSVRVSPILLLLPSSMNTDARVKTFFLQWMKQFGSGKSDKWEAFSHVVVRPSLPLRKPRLTLGSRKPRALY